MNSSKKMLYKGEIGEVSVNPEGNKCDVEWKMDFVNLSKKVGVYYWSPDFSFKGESWYLGIWPNGSKSKDSDGFVDLRLRIRTSGPPISCEFSFALKTVNGQKDLEKFCTGVFKKDTLHGIYRFISRSELVRRKSEFMASGFLSVTCTIKILNYVESTSKSCLYYRINIITDTIFTTNMSDNCSRANSYKYFEI